MPHPKKVDRSSVRAGGAAGVDRGRSGTLPDPSVSRRALATDRPARALSARIRARGDGQADDALPSGEWRGTGQGGAQLPERGATSVARSGTAHDPRGVASTARGI